MSNGIGLVLEERTHSVAYQLRDVCEDHGPEARVHYDGVYLSGCPLCEAEERIAELEPDEEAEALEEELSRRSLYQITGEDLSEVLTTAVSRAVAATVEALRRPAPAVEPASSAGIQHRKPPIPKKATRKKTPRKKAARRKAGA